MALAEIHWNESTGSPRTVAGRLEDTSHSGACIRIAVPLSVGERVRVAWRGVEFFGITKYCRSEGKDFVIGVHRESDRASLHSAHTEIARQTVERAPREDAATRRSAESDTVGNLLSSSKPARPPQSPGHWNNFLATFLSTGNVYPLESLSQSRATLSLQKVMQLLGGKTIREMSSEMKKASIQMALEIAGIRFEEILQDAKMRLRVLDAYEAEQEGFVDELEVLRQKENITIQQEIDRLTAKYSQRLRQNVEDVSAARASFIKWRSEKREECERIKDAMEICTELADNIHAPVAASPASVLAWSERKT